MNTPHPTPPPTSDIPLALEVAALLNRFNMESGSDTPDFILARYLLDCLKAFNSAVTHRAAWYANPPGLPEPCCDVPPVGGPPVGGPSHALDQNPYDEPPTSHPDA